LKNSRARAAEIELAAPDIRVSVQSLINNRDEAGNNLLQNNGYSPVRYYWRMEIKLTEAPATVYLPPGIQLRPFIRDEHAVAAWQADNEAFHDHWGSHDRTESTKAHACVEKRSTSLAVSRACLD